MAESNESLFQFGRWLSLLLVGLWKLSADPKKQFPLLFSAGKGMESQKVSRGLSWLFYGVVSLGYCDNVLELLVTNSAILSDSIHSCLNVDHHGSIESISRGFFIIKTWSFICVRMVNNDPKGKFAYGTSVPLFSSSPSAVISPLCSLSFSLFLLAAC